MEPARAPMVDVVTAGAGPADLSAALILGRCRRRVLVCDSGQYRNTASHALHGFLSRDGSARAELLRIGREEVRRFDSVELRRVEIADARGALGGVCPERKHRVGGARRVGQPREGEADHRRRERR